ncbi:MAG TPA: DUF4345 domain-containing protein [Cyclobacteriaceae bacterium]|nr:DUF4345 domain-containing protein [Cyclobacteriaceae bacterium]
MTAKTIYLVSSKGFIIFSALSLVYVAAMAMISPQSVMDLVGVQLPNNDAISSIRGIYGGVGITIFLMLIYLAFNNAQQGLVFLSVFWGSYAFSRIITWISEGSLGAFGNNWLIIESIFCMIGLVLVLFAKQLKKS